MGLVDESKKYAALLGYNYQSSEWYKQSYKILNEDYKITQQKKMKDNKQKLLDRIKSFF